jgi:phosphatidate cytidylyltransferase
MAFNRKTFRTRTLTAIIFVAIMLAGLLWNQWSFPCFVFHYSFWLLVGVLEADRKNT